MAKLGIIGGTGVFESKIFSSKKWKEVNTEYGNVQIVDLNSIVLLQRHGLPPLPPHSINHKANITALKQEGVTRIVAFNSVGSMNPEIKPGTITLPDDYLSPWNIPTFYDTECCFTTPEIDERLRKQLISLLSSLKIPYKEGGTYFQAQGPRFETKAEIRMFRSFADIVGMTLANEAILARESEIPYASICTVDNYANGIMGETIYERNIEEGQRKSLALVEKILTALLEWRV